MADRVLMNEQAAVDLGERKPPKGNRIAWAIRKLRQGFYVARYGWDLETSPKRVYCWFDSAGDIEMVKVWSEDRTVSVLKLSWQDVSATDWYLVEELEMFR